MCDIPSMTCFMHDTPLISPPFPASAFPKHKACFPPEITTPLMLQLLDNQALFDLSSPQTPAIRFAIERSPFPNLYSDEKWQLAHDKVSTNMFVAESSNSGMFGGNAVLKLATKTSFFNHSCRSNAIVHAIHGTMKQQVETVRDIVKGMKIKIYSHIVITLILHSLIRRRTLYFIPRRWLFASGRTSTSTARTWLRVPL